MEIKKALDIAKKDLRACYYKEGIVAGISHFDDYWARDAFYASLGALEIKDYDIVKKNLLLFIKHQKENGQIPLRYGYNALAIFFKLIGLKMQFKKHAIYRTDNIISVPTDQNSLFVIVFHEYVKKTKDKEFAKKHFSAVNNAILWNLSMCENLLIKENYYANWADTHKKRGKVLYTNVLHCKALESFSELCRLLGKTEYKKYLNLHKEVNQRINKLFWKKDYYIDWIGKKKHDYFSTDGNVLAIVFGIANQKQAQKIESFIDKHQINKVPSLTNYPKYPNKMINPVLRILGMKDYQNGMSWQWLGCMNIISKHKSGQTKQAKELQKKISKIIVKYNGVYEVFERSGKPVNRRFYKSEQPFAWGAGLFVYAYYMINNS